MNDLKGFNIFWLKENIKIALKDFSSILNNLKTDYPYYIIIFAIIVIISSLGGPCQDEDNTNKVFLNTTDYADISIVRDSFYAGACVKYYIKGIEDDNTQENYEGFIRVTSVEGENIYIEEGSGDDYQDIVRTKDNVADYTMYSLFFDHTACEKQRNVEDITVTAGNFKDAVHYKISCSEDNNVVVAYDFWLHDDVPNGAMVKINVEKWITGATSIWELSAFKSQTEDVGDCE